MGTFLSNKSFILFVFFDNFNFLLSAPNGLPNLFPAALRLANSSSSIMEKKDEIEKLFQLKEKGIITEKQFQEKKSEILQN